MQLTTHAKRQLRPERPSLEASYVRSIPKAL
jgi:hypothetical protein